MRQTLLLGFVLGMLAQTFSFPFGGTFKSAGSSSYHVRKVAGKTFKKGATFFGARFKVAGHAAKKISNGIGKAASAIGSGAQKAGEKLGTLSKSVGDSIGPVFESLPSFMKDVMQRIGGWAKEILIGLSVVATMTALCCLTYYVNSFFGMCKVFFVAVKSLSGNGVAI